MLNNNLYQVLTSSKNKTVKRQIVSGRKARLKDKIRSTYLRLKTGFSGIYKLQMAVL